MDIAYYKEFIELARRLNFHEAAAVLNLSQSALSKHILAFERHYDVQLFDRGRRQVTLTDAGVILLEQALRIWSAYEESIAIMGASRERECIRASGLIDAPDEHATMGRVMALVQSGDVPCSIRTVACDSTSPRLLADKVASGNIDCAVTYLDEEDFIRWEDADEFEVTRIAQIPLDIIVSSSSGLAGKKAVRPADMAGAAFVHLAGSRFTPIWALIEKRLTATGMPFTVKPHIASGVYDYSNLDLRERILIMPRKESAPELTENPRYALLKIDDPSFHLDMCAIYKRGGHDAAMECFLTALKTSFGARSAKPG